MQKIPLRHMFLVCISRVDRAVASMDVEETDTALVYHNGTVVYIPSAIFSSSCPLDMTHFPFDTQVTVLGYPKRKVILKGFFIILI